MAGLWSRPGAGRSAPLAALLLCIVAAGSCGSGSISSEEAQAEAEYVLRADLRSGSDGKTAAELTRKFTDVEGVAATRGDGGSHVWVYLLADTTTRELESVCDDLADEPAVIAVVLTRSADRKAADELRC